MHLYSLHHGATLEARLCSRSDRNDSTSAVALGRSLLRRSVSLLLAVIDDPLGPASSLRLSRTKEDFRMRSESEEEVQLARSERAEAPQSVGRCWTGWSLLHSYCHWLRSTLKTNHLFQLTHCKVGQLYLFPLLFLLNEF